MATHPRLAEAYARHLLANDADSKDKTGLLTSLAFPIAHRRSIFD